MGTVKTDVFRRTETPLSEAEERARSLDQVLATTVRQLESLHRDGEALSHMAELLQSCTQRDEAYGIVRETVARLFAGVSGALYIYRESRDAVEHVATWGAGKPPELVLTPDDCWGLRLGRPHYVHRQGAVRCRHA